MEPRSASPYGSQQLQQPHSPGAAGTPPKRQGLLSLSPFKRTPTDDRGTPGSGMGGWPSPPGGGAAGSDAGTPPATATRSGLLPSYAHSVRKREIIRAQEEQLAALRAAAQRRDADFDRLQAELEAERLSATSLQERLNMQYFKSSLLLDILVARLLEAREAATAATAGAAAAAAAAAAGVPGEDVGGAGGPEAAPAEQGAAGAGEEEGEEEEGEEEEEVAVEEASGEDEFS